MAGLRTGWFAPAPARDRFVVQVGDRLQVHRWHERQPLAKLLLPSRVLGCTPVWATDGELLVAHDRTVASWRPGGTGEPIPLRTLDEDITAMALFDLGVLLGTADGRVRYFVPGAPPGADGRGWELSLPVSAPVRQICSTGAGPRQRLAVLADGELFLSHPGVGGPSGASWAASYPVSYAGGSMCWVPGEPPRLLLVEGGRCTLHESRYSVYLCSAAAVSDWGDDGAAIIAPLPGEQGYGVRFAFAQGTRLHLSALRPARGARPVPATARWAGGAVAVADRTRHVSVLNPLAAAEAEAAPAVAELARPASPPASPPADPPASPPAKRACAPSGWAALPPPPADGCPDVPGPDSPASTQTVPNSPILESPSATSTDTAPNSPY